MSFSGNASVVASHAALRLLSSATYQTAFVQGDIAAPDGGGGTYTYVASNTSGCQFTASVSGTTLTVSAVTSGALSVGFSVNRTDTGASIGTIVSLGTGTGGTGTYTLNASATIASMGFTADDDSYFMVAVNGARWFQVGAYPQTAAERAAAVTPTNYGYPPYSALRYGLDPTGTNDSTTALNNAFASAAEAGYGEVSIGVPGALVKVNGNLSINTNVCGFDGQGCLINASGMTSGYLFNPTQTPSLNGLVRTALNRSHPIRNFVASGPGPGVDVGFILFNDTTANSMPGITVSNGGSWDFQTHATYQNGAVFETFENWFFDSGGIYAPDGGGTVNFVNFPEKATNSGERNTFRNVRFGISTMAAIVHQNPDTHTILQDVSWNCIGGGAGQFISQSAGMIQGNGIHIESDRDSEYWISIAGATATNAICMLQNVQIVCDVAKTTRAVAYCDAAVTWGKLSIRDFQLSAPDGYDLPLIAGTGNAFVDNHVELGTAAGQPYYHAEALNVMADPIFASGSFATDGWTASGGSPPVINTTNPYTGATNAVYFTGGYSTLTSRALPCRPGQLALVQLQCAITNYAAGNFVATIAYLNAAGNAIGTQFQFMNLSANQAYTAETASVSGGNKLAPPGTVSVQVALALVSGGTTKAYLGQCILTIA